MATRTYDQDAYEVLNAAAGDNGAMAALLREYAPNLRGVVKKFEHRIEFEDGMQIVSLAFIEYVLNADESKARRIRTAVNGIALDAMNAACAPGLGSVSFKNARAAAESMRAPVEQDAPAALSLYEAAEKHKGSGLSVSLLANYLLLDQAASLDALVDEAYDDENPFGLDMAGASDVSDLDPHHDPEFLSRPSLSHFDVKCESVGVSREVHKVMRVQRAVDALPKRQKEVVRLLMAGETETSIAAQLGVAFRTVVNTRANAYASLRMALAD